MKIILFLIALLFVFSIALVACEVKDNVDEGSFEPTAQVTEVAEEESDYDSNIGVFISPSGGIKIGIELGNNLYISPDGLEIGFGIGD